MGKDKNIKISFIGDIMCEKPLLKSSLVQDDYYDFDNVFSNMEDVFKKSDYVVGNLETVCAGKEMGYTNHIYNFNTPDSFIESIKKSGIDLVTTATNHCLDRGLEGLKKNLSVLEKNNLDSVGTYSSPEDREKVFLKDFNGVRVAFLNYTYGTNVHINEVILEENELFHVNLLKPQDEEIKRLKYKKTSKSLKSRLARVIFKMISLEKWIGLKRKLGLTYNKAYQDNSLEGIEHEYLERIKNDIKKAKSKADFVVMCMHSGGQFNVEPGKYSQYMMNFMSENGVDVVVGNHPHVVQKHEMFTTGMFGAYSLGNFSISPSSVYVLHDDLPEYSIMLHLYIGKISRRLEKVTFSILKIVEGRSKNLEVYPLKELFKIEKEDGKKNKLLSDATIIYNRVLGKCAKKIKLQDEYKIKI